MTAFLVVLGGAPFQVFTVRWIYFLVHIPVALALGFDDSAPDLMKHKPRPLKRPILSSPQWVRIAFIGILMSIGTIWLANYYQSSDELVARSMGLVIISLAVIVLTLGSRKEHASEFNRDVIKNRHPLMLYGLSFIIVLLPLNLDFLQRFPGFTNLDTTQVIICLGFAIGLLLVDEVIKFFMRRRVRQPVEKPVNAELRKA